MTKQLLVPATLLILAFTQAPALAKPAVAFCPALKKIVVATDTGWKTVRRGNSGTIILPGTSKCSVDVTPGASSNYSCSSELTATTVKAANAKLVSDVQSCLGTQPTHSGDDVQSSDTFTLPGSPVRVIVTLTEQPWVKSWTTAITIELPS